MDSAKVLSIFQEITKIPRESGHEAPMTAFLQAFAAERGLACKTDAIGNVCISKEAAKGKEGVPTLALQGHQDMVCEKRAGYVHDFQKDPIRYVIEDGWMIAKDTTLGADDGIGVAAMLALLDSDLKTGRLECIFTVSEETGMDGAFAMEPGFFTGRTLINLDSEDEGQLFIGCAGGVDTFARFRYVPEDRRADFDTVQLRIGGAMGGHSGDDINKGRMNTIQQMARFLYSELGREFQLIVLKGGNKPNAIARDCEAKLSVPDIPGIVERFKAFGAQVRQEYAKTDPGVTFEAEAFRCTEKPIQSGVARKLITALYACPHGVEAMSPDIPGLVETSTNLASVRMRNLGEVEVVTSQRSSVSSAKDMMAGKVEANFKLAGAVVEHAFAYPGWKPDMDSPILKVCFDSYKKLFGVEPEVKAIHAGLECGLFAEKFGDLDMISFGPTLRGVHAPGERLELASLDKFVKHLADVVTHYR